MFASRRATAISALWFRVKRAKACYCLHENLRARIASLRQEIGTASSVLFISALPFLQQGLAVSKKRLKPTWIPTCRSMVLCDLLDVYTHISYTRFGSAKLVILDHVKLSRVASVTLRKPKHLQLHTSRQRHCKGPVLLNSAAVRGFPRTLRDPFPIGDTSRRPSMSGCPTILSICLPSLSRRGVDIPIRARSPVGCAVY